MRRIKITSPINRVPLWVAALLGLQFIFSCAQDMQLGDRNNLSLTINSPADGAHIGYQDYFEFDLSGSCSDDGADVSISGAISATVNCDGGSWEKLDVDLSPSGLDLADGDFTISVSMQDKLENIVTDRATYHLDTIFPRIEIVESTAADDTYGLGEKIPLRVRFSEPVYVDYDLLAGEIPLLVMNTGTAALYESGAGTYYLNFGYTVGPAGLPLMELSYADTTSLWPNGSTIYDRAGNEMDPVYGDFDLAAAGSAGSLEYENNIFVKTTSPTVVAVTANEDGVHAAGDVITLAVSFSEAVFVSGTPRLGLDFSTTTAFATYTSTSGSVLYLNYTVAQGVEAADLTYATTTSLSDGTIIDSFENIATRTLPATATFSGANAIVVDGISPTIVSLTTTVADGTYGPASVEMPLPITLNFSENITVTGSPYIILNSASSATAYYDSGSGSSAITYTYNAQTGEGSGILDVSSMGVSGLADSAGNLVNLSSLATATMLMESSSIAIDGIAPQVTSVTATSVSDGLYGGGDLITIEVNFDEVVTLSGGVLSLITNTSGGTIAYYDTGSGSTQLTFTFAVESGSSSLDLNYAATDSLNIAGGTLQDDYGNNANLALPALTSGSSMADRAIVIDGTPPGIASITTTKDDGYYKASISIPIKVEFNEEITINDGTYFSLLLDSGGSATFVALDGSNALLFNYTILASENSADLAIVSFDSVAGGTIADAVGNEVAFPLAWGSGLTGSDGSDKSVVVDTTPPTQGSPFIGSVTNPGYYTEGALIDITIYFSEPIEVICPIFSDIQLALNTNPAASAFYVSSSANGLSLQYEVADGENTVDTLDYQDSASLIVSGVASITDLAGNSAILTLENPLALNSLNDTAPIYIDTIDPTITSVVTTIPNGTYGVGKSIDAVVTFTEDVTIDSESGCALELNAQAAGSASAVYSSYAAGVLTLTYTVASGADTSALNYSATNSLTATSATSIHDVAGNIAVLTLPELTAAESLGGSSAIVIDANPPVLANVTSATADGTYIVGDEIPLELTFNEGIDLSGAPTITLNSASAAAATFVSYTNFAASFNYQVLSGHTTGSAQLATLGIGSGGVVCDLVADPAPNCAEFTTSMLTALPAGSSLEGNKNIYIDGVVPTVASVSATLVSGTYSSNVIVPIVVTFSEAVTFVASTIPAIAMNTNTNAQATYLSGAGSEIFTFFFVAGAGEETTGALNYMDVDSLLDYGELIDQSGNVMIDGTLPDLSGQLGGKNIYLANDTISSNKDSNCAITANGLLCWGDNGSGQLGNGSDVSSDRPTVVVGMQTETTASTTSPSAVSVGYDHTCAVKNGEVYCWGSNAYGQLGDGGTVSSNRPVSTGVVAKTVASGNLFSCAINSSYGLECWGDDGAMLSSQTSPTTIFASNVFNVALGANHACVVAGSEIKCWGDNSYGQLGQDIILVPTATSPTILASPLSEQAIYLALGANHSCALTVSGKIYCWGSNEYGQLGDSVLDVYSEIPVQLASSGASKLVAGSNHTCAVVGGVAQCWGDNFSGQLGAGDSGDIKTSLTSVLALSDITTNFNLSAGDQHSCLFYAHGMRCWGDNTIGQIGFPYKASGQDYLRPLKVAGAGMGQVITGTNHSCYLVGRTIRCWGDNSSGELGISLVTATASSPTSVRADLSGTILTDVTALALGQKFSCAVIGGGVKCWGENEQGQLGIGSAVDKNYASEVINLSAGSYAYKIAVGEAHACAYLNSMSDPMPGIKCWGANNDGQLGDNTTTAHSTAVDVFFADGQLSVIDMQAGANHTCVVNNFSSAGDVYCWGDNSSQQLNDTVTSYLNAPTKINEVVGPIMVQVATGANHTCLLSSVGVVFCRGANASGQTGVDSATNPVTSLTQVAGISNIVAISAGGDNTCALSAANEAYCWGDNSYSQLGTAGDATYTPQLISLNSNYKVANIDVGTNYVCLSAIYDPTIAPIVEDNYKYICWGANSVGQLGIGTSSSSDISMGVRTLK
ncbi:MAG: hypothetical protein A2504_00755 [Bdellovibrionales bacterium RIFOXYD12_FULL_39_22]|nr:MAG: hypothetical protein A2385_03375 [Bdellovibrionales bacterium RIFOXYB1_FULL_39_21]OFZ42632.1 MAG: hypothetical protein A2485_09930 [Bdellovibrionales bacterium RIFOXYC12_FULL_39_17]OFZ47100.1 MAG: hypothetical protein A2404_15365 [Bdellovibrionales bacterium RIFOXYC1_FULL_39_130]OFZ75348.1 MAG: hypothetical protein A2560_14140 [Bdellovibrionales bacterium RIFOXYD1_FULL_39_84]OFZ93299.1 MAG: hypothetical protein A2504_00755 [Bdellovibrionales bacterium RIFOXYD12_FULL_39_22]HLE10025.1 hy